MHACMYSAIPPVFYNYICIVYVCPLQVIVLFLFVYMYHAICMSSAIPPVLYNYICIVYVCPLQVFALFLLFTCIMQYERMYVFCNSTCVLQLSLYCICLSVADRQQCCTGWSMGEFLTRVKRESRRKESLPVKGLQDIYFRFATCILFISRSRQFLWFHGRMQLPLCDLKRKHECSQFNFSFSGPAQSTKTEFGGFRWTVWKLNF